MDYYNNVGRQVTLNGKIWQITGTTEDGKFYFLCDVYGREIQLPLHKVIGAGTSLA